MSASDGLIIGYSLTAPDEGWDEMLAAFRALGGVADNLRLGRGRLGRGLFPVEPGRFRLHIPENLMFPVEDIVFIGDRIRLSDSSGTAKPEREFFERYANGFSWGGGRQDALALVAAFDALPNDVRALLVSEFGMADWLEGERTMRAQRQFLYSRAYDVRGNDVILPMLELANHDSGGLRWSIEQGVEVAGEATDEIFMSYGLHDSFAVFHRFAFASREPAAFSLPMNVQLDAISLDIERTFETAQRGGTLVPRLKDTGEGLALSYLMLGSPDRPKLARGLFRAVVKPLGVVNADEEFDRILHANWTQFLKLLTALEPHSGALVVSLRNMALYQLEAMSYCIGAREP